MRGKSYAIEYHTVANQWQPMETFIHHPNKQLYIDPNSDTSSLFYRVRVID